MPVPAKKSALSNGDPERRSTRSGARSRRATADDDLGAPALRTGEIRIEAGPAFSSATRLRVRGLNVLMQAGPAQEKQKVSVTLDKTLVDDIRAQFGGRALSTSINTLLYAALAQERLAELVDEMEREAAPPSPEAYERVLAEWFAED